MHYYPSDTFNLINGNDVEISNFALRYHYFLGTRRVGEKLAFGLQAEQHQVPSLENSQIEPLRNRQTDQLRHLASNGHFYCATSRMDWRMVIGLGSNHVQETNMTLDHVYGIPYLPGSAFKGIVRSWVIQKYFDNNENLATRDIEEEDSPDLQKKKKNFFIVFGSQESAARVQFLDALPNSGVHFDIDIMNPHFSQYYTRSSSQFPTDYQKLIQIYFLTLKNTHFRFLIVAKEANALQLVKDWFTEAINARGFGAKSAVGYGYFREPNDKTAELRYEFEKLSLDEAYNIYCINQQESIFINVEPLIDYASKFAFIVTEGICEIREIEKVHEIPETLIETEAGIVVPSEFGKWVWAKTKDKLFEETLPPFPNLIYRGNFRQSLRALPVEDRKLLQENLLQIAINFRRAFHTNLPPNERKMFEDRLLRVIEKLEDGTMFANSLTIDRQLLVQKLWEIAGDSEDTAAIPESINVEGGRRIQLDGTKNGSLVLKGIQIHKGDL